MTNYRADDSNLRYIGRYVDDATYRDLRGGGTRVAFKMHGKSLQLKVSVVVYSATLTMEYSTDGGTTFTAYDFGATGTFTTSDLVGAGSDGDYEIVVRVGTSQYFKFFLVDGIQIGADGTASLSPPTEDWQASWFNDSTNWTDLLANASLGANVRGHTFNGLDTQYGYSATDQKGYLPTWYDPFAVFKCSCTKIAIFGRRGVYQLYRDGVAVGSAITQPTTVHTLTVLSASEDGEEHEYRIIGSTKSANHQVNAVCILGTYSTNAPTLGNRIVFLGDSTTENTAASPPSNGHVAKLIGKYGIVGFNRGIAGNTSAQMLTRQAADCLAIPGLYAICITSGANDGAVADATLQATMESMYTASLAYDAAIKCFVIEAFPSVSNREGAVNLAAVTAVANARCTYTDTDGWIIATAGVDTTDGQHPNASGGTKIADQMAAILIVNTSYKNVLLLGVG